MNKSREDLPLEVIKHKIIDYKRYKKLFFSILISLATLFAIPVYQLFNSGELIMQIISGLFTFVYSGYALGFATVMNLKLAEVMSGKKKMKKIARKLSTDGKRKSLTTEDIKNFRLVDGKEQIELQTKLGIPNGNIYTDDRDVIIETIPKKPKQNDNGLFVYGNNVFEGLSPVYSDADGYQYEIRSLNSMDSQDEKDKEAASSFIKRFKNIQ